MQKTCNSIANALELPLFCIKLSLAQCSWKDFRLIRQHVWWFWANHQTFCKNRQTFQFKCYMKIFFSRSDNMNVWWFWTDHQTFCKTIGNVWWLFMNIALIFIMEIPVPWKTVLIHVSKWGLASRDQQNCPTRESSTVSKVPTSKPVRPPPPWPLRRCISKNGLARSVIL